MFTGLVSTGLHPILVCISRVAPFVCRNVDSAVLWETGCIQAAKISAALAIVQLGEVIQHCSFLSGRFLGVRSHLICKLPCDLFIYELDVSLQRTRRALARSVLTDLYRRNQWLM
jgi:hypothetical protein